MFLTLKQARALLEDIDTARSLARSEKSSHRLQNRLDKVAVRVKKAIRHAESAEMGLFRTERR